MLTATPAQNKREKFSECGSAFECGVLVDCCVFFVAFLCGGEAYAGALGQAKATCLTPKPYTLYKFEKKRSESPKMLLVAQKVRAFIWQS